MPFNRLTVSLLVAFTSTVLLAQSPPVISWQECYGGSGYESALDIIELDNGDYMIAGLSSSNDGDVSSNYGLGDVWLTRLSNTGTLLWEKNYGGSLNEYGEIVIQTSDGNLVILAESDSDDGDVSLNQGQADLWIFKIDGNGNLLWEHSYGGGDEDSPISIVESSMGELYVLSTTWSVNGDISSPNGLTDMWLLKLDSAGNLIWEDSFGGSGAEEAHTVIADPFGGCYFGGFTTSSNGDVSNFIGGTNDGWLVHVDVNGNMLSEKTFGGQGADAIRHMILLSDGSINCIGDSDSNTGDLTSNNGVEDMWVFRVDSAMNIIWSSSFGGSAFETAVESRVTPFDETIILSVTESSNVDISLNHGSLDHWLVKVDGTGDFIWERTIGSAAPEFPLGLEFTQTGKILVSGAGGSLGGDITCPSTGNFWLAELNEANIGVPENDINELSLSSLGANAYKLSLTETANGVLIVRDALGKEVFSKTFKGVSTVVNLDTYRAGTYLIQLQTDTRLYFKRAVVE